MPKPPGNGVYRLVRGHRPRSAAGEYPRPTASLLSETDSSACNVIGDGCQGLCHCIYDVPCSDDCLPADNALGQSRRVAHCGWMSALPPIATASADGRTVAPARVLCPQTTPRQLAARAFSSGLRSRQRCLCLSNEAADNRSNRQNFTDAAGGLTCPENTLMLATGLGR
jgi:hypothetical protein